MTEHVQLEIIAAVLVIAGQIVAVWRANVAASLAAMALIQTQQKNAAVQDIHNIVKVLKVEVNDRLTQLLSVSRSAALLEGEATGTRQTRDAIASQQGHNDDPRLERAVIAARQLITEAAIAARNLVIETGIQKSNAALPPVVVPANTEPRETKGGGWVMEGPNENPMARKAQP